MSDDDLLIELDKHTPDHLEMDGWESPTQASDILDKKFMNKRLVSKKLQSEMLNF